MEAGGEGCSGYIPVRIGIFPTNGVGYPGLLKGFGDVEIGRYLRGFYRYLIFTTLFAPKVFAGPLEIIHTRVFDGDLLNPPVTDLDLCYERVKSAELQQLLHAYPLFKPAVAVQIFGARRFDFLVWSSGMEYFEGYFDWLCAQGLNDNPARTHQILSEMVLVGDHMEDEVKWQGVNDRLRSMLPSYPQTKGYPWKTTLFLSISFGPSTISRCRSRVTPGQTSEEVINNLANSSSLLIENLTTNCSSNTFFEIMVSNRGRGRRSTINSKLTCMNNVERVMMDRYIRRFSKLDNPAYRHRTSSMDALSSNYNRSEVTVPYEIDNYRGIILQDSDSLITDSEELKTMR